MEDNIDPPESDHSLHERQDHIRRLAGDSPAGVTMPWSWPEIAPELLAFHVAQVLLVSHLENKCHI